jgi:YfiH family protein
MLDFYQFRHFSSFVALLHTITTKSPKLSHQGSLALHTQESPQEIRKNRKKIAQVLENKSPQTLYFVVANQTHSSHIKIIDKKESKGWEYEENAINNCDAMICNIPHVMLTILTADCVPILLYDPKQKVIAVVHAGWKGTNKNILLKTVAKMKEVFSCNPQDIRAGIAPSIGQCCYEVGEDVIQYFRESPKSYTQHKDKYKLNLPYLNKEQLRQAGLNIEHIECSHICTACESERFFSYRKENACTGRFMSIIGLL